MGATDKVYDLYTSCSSRGEMTHKARGTRDVVEAELVALKRDAIQYGHKIRSEIKEVTTK